MNKVLITLVSVLMLSACNSGGSNPSGNSSANLNNSHTQSTQIITPTVPVGYEKDAESCHSNGGLLLVGTVAATPVYKSGSLRQGVELSHTHITINPLGTTNPNAAYDMAVDNAFAAGYDAAQPNKAVPAPLSSLMIGTLIEACGLTYSNGNGAIKQGIHFVHLNDQPIIPNVTANGWVKVVNPDGTLSDNLEGSAEYSYLWN